MKAWYLTTRDGDDGSFIVFANTRNEARAQADSNDLMYDSWLDIVATRAKRWDDKEKLPKRELDKELWRDGWQWLEYEPPEESESTDQDFYDWYDKAFGGQ